MSKTLAFHSPEPESHRTKGSPEHPKGHADHLIEPHGGVLVDLLAGAMFAPVSEQLRTFQAELEMSGFTE